MVKGVNMGSEWRVVPLGKIAKLNESTYSPQENWPFVNYLDTGNITDNRISEIQHLVTGTDKIPTRARRKVEPGDIVYSTVRPNQRHFGLIRDVPDNFLVSTGFAVIRGKDDVACTDFIYWFLAQDHIVEYLHSIAENSTSAYPSIRPGDLEQLVLSLPPLPEQRAIAHILGTLDDKIELNRRLNQTLEAMARAIFQDWFVDFGPVRAKLAGQEPYLPPELWALFPDRLAATELGEAPEWWGVKALGELLDDIIGGDWGKENPDSPHTSPVWVIRGTDMAHISKGDVGTVPLRYTTTKKLERRMLRDCDIIIEVSGGGPTQSTGRSVLVTQEMLDSFPGQAVCASFCRRLRPYSWKEGLLVSQCLDFLYSKGKMWDYQLQSTNIANFETKRFFQEEKIAWPGDELRDKITEILEPIVRLKAQRETIALAALRDTLLPRLVSGEVTVGEAKQSVASVCGFRKTN